MESRELKDEQKVVPGFHERYKLRNQPTRTEIEEWRLSNTWA